MIRTDGYYIEEPNEIVDGRISPSTYSYIFLAYCFDNEFNVYLSSQHQRLSELVDFDSGFFHAPKASMQKWYQKNGEVIIEKEFEFGKDILMRELSANELYNTNSKKHLHFVPWSSVEEEQETGGILKRIFGPFEKGKYKSVHT